MTINLSKVKLPCRVRLRNDMETEVARNSIDSTYPYEGKAKVSYAHLENPIWNAKGEWICGEVSAFDIVEIIPDTPDEPTKPNAVLNFAGYSSPYKDGIGYSGAAPRRSQVDSHALFSIPLADFDRLPEDMKREIKI